MSSDAEQKPKITVYWLDQSRSQRILWLLEELKVDYEVKVFKRNKDMLAPQELKDVHPLGKSPVIGIQAPGAEKSLILAESGHIVEYLTEHLGQWMIPKRYINGKEGQIGGETEEWLRYRYYMHYAEGSIMPLILIGLFISMIRDGPQPFFVRPITRMISGRVDSLFLNPNRKTHFDFLEDQLKTSPDEGEFFCGKELTGADILMIFPLEAARGSGLITQEKYPKLVAYVKKIHEREAFKKAIEKIEEVSDEKYQPVASRR
ncbi:glutathione transferase [Viridothelium virens]|uniref:glutathione transferase n=1 Tax=Viridothelium virens TaxID=1048519 RepID=A0A6A6H2G5_VIRVR|nr:glutathione transferase [Viridothelium virens]